MSHAAQETLSVELTDANDEPTAITEVATDPVTDAAVDATADDKNAAEMAALASEAAIDAKLAELELPEAPRLTLRDIANESLLIDALINQADGELTPELEQRLNTLLDDSILHKTDGTVAYLNGMLAEGKHIRAEEVRLASRRHNFEKRFDRYVLYIKTQMERMGRLVIDGEFNQLAVVNNPAKLEVFDESLVPEAYKTTETIPEQKVTTVREDDIKRALQNREKALAERDKLILRAEKKGLPVPQFNEADLPQDVPGAKLVRGTRLRIS